MNSLQTYKLKYNLQVSMRCNFEKHSLLTSNKVKLFKITTQCSKLTRKRDVVATRLTSVFLNFVDIYEGRKVYDLLMTVLGFVFIRHLQSRRRRRRKDFHIPRRKCWEKNSLKLCHIYLGSLLQDIQTRFFELEIRRYD